jgi:hypothetical protein
MTSKMILAISAGALSLALTTLAQAAPEPVPAEGHAPPSNPHDVFRANVKVRGSAAQAVAPCDCPMMKASAAMAEHGMDRG